MVLNAGWWKGSGTKGSPEICFVRSARQLRTAVAGSVASGIKYLAERVDWRMKTYVSQILETSLKIAETAGGKLLSV